MPLDKYITTVTKFVGNEHAAVMTAINVIHNSIMQASSTPTNSMAGLKYKTESKQQTWTQRWLSHDIVQQVFAKPRHDMEPSIEYHVPCQHLALYNVTSFTWYETLFTFIFYTSSSQTSLGECTPEESSGNQGTLTRMVYMLDVKECTQYKEIPDGSITS